jgi:hypothetical protein
MAVKHAERISPHDRSPHCGTHNGTPDLHGPQSPRAHCSVDAVHFLAPLRVGAVAIIAAMVNRTFASSMEVGPAAWPCTLRRHRCYI